jgi:mannose-6-phosphate isomerase-like protein (cupin superfamily)
MPDDFVPFDVAHGPLAEVGPEPFASRLAAWDGGRLALAPGGTHFGFVCRGRAEISCGAGDFRLGAGMYFAVPGAGSVAGEGDGVVVTREGFRGLFMLGGPLEPDGRLRYIDGCTDTLLVPPVMLGDPCLNALYFPPATDQTEHTHPTARVGVVASGRGECVTPRRTFALSPGLAFVIPAGAHHRFRTGEDPMVVVAYHPDSDAGPTHESHPMINRTIVDGVSAARLGALHTRPR